MELKDFVSKYSVSITLFLGVIILGLITYIETENPFTFSNATLHYIMYGTICFIFSALMTLEIYALIFFKIEGWVKPSPFDLGIPFFLSNITTSILILQQDFRYYQINFWLCLSCWIYLYIATTNWKVKDSDTNHTVVQNVNIPFENIIILLGAAWTISSVFITLGTTLFDYGKLPIKNIQAIHSLLDIRINLAIVLIAFIAIKSTVIVFQKKKVELKPLFKPREQVIENRNETNLFLHVLTVFLNIAINLIGNLGNIFYKVLATVIIYLFYIGGEIFNSFSTLLKISIKLFFYLAELISVITAFHFIDRISIPLLQYLTENAWDKSYLPLLTVLFYFSILIVCIIAIHYFRSLGYDDKERRVKKNIEDFNEHLARDIQALPYLISVIWMIGVIIFFIAKIDFLHFKTFKTFGILATILSSVVFVGFIIYLYNNFRPMKQTNNIPSKTS